MPVERSGNNKWADEGEDEEFEVMCGGFRFVYFYFIIRLKLIAMVTKTG
jgi:hypothetical protein